ncbi:MAG: iron ABC transporter permease [Thermoleophilia bacterium]|nr:iron ABC transporter permease [Thermoleophilia bacterium]
MISVTIGLFMAAPAAYIVMRALGADAETWARLLSARVPSLLGSTLSLTLAVTALTILMAVPAAWLAVRTDVPGKRFWQWSLALPLAIPPYIGGFAFITLFGPRGLLQQQLSETLGIPPHELSIPSIYSFAGALIVLSLFTYPYVFLLVSAALRSHNQNLIDAAKSSGLSPRRVFSRVTLPLLRPGMAAGGLLVALYVLSDFGAITLLRYPTFTSVIYQQLVGRYDRQAAAVLSMVLMLITIAVIWLEWRSRAKVRYFQTASFRPAETVRLSRWKWPAVIFLSLLFFAALILPLSVLSYWSVIGISQGALTSDFSRYALNSFFASFLAASAAVLLAFPVAYLATRHGGLFSHGVLRLSYSGYALPGVLVGLGMVFFFNSAIPWLYGTLAVLILAYIIRFLPQCLQAEESGLASISPVLEEAARSMGHGTAKVVRRVTVPLMFPSMAAGWVLVFLSAMKELPVTLMLRPAGFDTLAVRVWIDASEGFFATAALPSLLLVLASAGPLMFVIRRRYSLRTGRSE